MAKKSVKFEIVGNAVNYAATLEKDGGLIDSIDKKSNGAETKNLSAGSYEARIYFRGQVGTHMTVTVTVDGKSKSRKFEIKNQGQTEARGGVPFVVA